MWPVTKWKLRSEAWNFQSHYNANKQDIQERVRSSYTETDWSGRRWAHNSPPQFFSPKTLENFALFWVHTWKRSWYFHGYQSSEWATKDNLGRELENSELKESCFREKFSSMGSQKTILYMTSTLKKYLEMPNRNVHLRHSSKTFCTSKTYKTINTELSKIIQNTVLPTLYMRVLY